MQSGGAQGFYPQGVWYPQRAASGHGHYVRARNEVDCQRKGQTKMEGNPCVLSNCGWPEIINSLQFIFECPSVYLFIRFRGCCNLPVHTYLTACLDVGHVCQIGEYAVLSFGSVLAGSAALRITIFVSALPAALHLFVVTPV